MPDHMKIVSNQTSGANIYVLAKQPGNNFRKYKKVNKSMDLKTGMSIKNFTNPEHRKPAKFIRQQSLFKGNFTGGQK